MLLTTLFVLLNATAAAIPPQTTGAAVASACKDTLPSAHARISGLLRLARMHPDSELGRLAGVSAAQVHPIDRNAEATVCRTLGARALANRPRDTVSGRPWHVAVMEGAGFYFVLVSSDPHGRGSSPGTSSRVRIGEGGWQVLVFDRNLDLVTAADT